MIWLILISYTFAVEGIVRVLEAPVFKQPDENTKVIQYHRKGAKVFVHPRDIYQDPYQEINKQELTAPDEVDNSAFYTTIDNNGHKAYILKRHVQLIIDDTREQDHPYTQKRDDTDYRIEEPLPRNYPFILSNTYRNYWGYSVGRLNRPQVNFSEQASSQSASLTHEINFSYSKTVDWDEANRFYFGFNTLLYSDSIETQLQSAKIKDDLIRFMIGPYLSYDTWKDTNFNINIHISLLYALFNQNTFTIEPSSESTLVKDELQTRSNHFMLRLGSQLHLLEAIEEYDFVLGFNFDIVQGHRSSTFAKPRSQLTVNALDSDSYINPHSQWSLQIAIQNQF